MQERVNDFQLGIESYQYRLNLRKPLITIPEIEDKVPYTLISKPKEGVVYLNIVGHKPLLHKQVFPTVKSVGNPVKKGPFPHISHGIIPFVKTFWVNIFL